MATNLIRDLKIVGVAISDVELGRGGYGVVYKAELRDKTKVAAKQLHSELCSQYAVSKFVEECQRLNELSDMNPHNLVLFHGVYFRDSAGWKRPSTTASPNQNQK